MSLKRIFGSDLFLCLFFFPPDCGLTFNPVVAFLLFIARMLAGLSNNGGGGVTQFPPFAQAAVATNGHRHQNGHNRQQMMGIEFPGPHDCVLGRGRGASSHIGNVTFRALIKQFKPKYEAASRVDKPKVAAEVVSIWRNMSPPGRFLVQCRTTNRSVWNDVGDRKARQKASQSLREREFKRRKRARDTRKPQPSRISGTSEPKDDEEMDDDAGSDSDSSSSSVPSEESSDSTSSSKPEAIMVSDSASSNKDKGRLNLETVQQKSMPIEGSDISGSSSSDNQRQRQHSSESGESSDSNRQHSESGESSDSGKS